MSKHVLCSAAHLQQLKLLLVLSGNGLFWDQLDTHWNEKHLISGTDVSTVDLTGINCNLVS